jgi:hypothetical protein
MHIISSFSYPSSNEGVFEIVDKNYFLKVFFI